MSHEMRARKSRASAITVITGITAMIREAWEAEVSLMPRASKKKYTVTPKSPLAARGRRSFLRKRAAGSKRRRKMFRITVATTKRMVTMVIGGTPEERMVLELTKDSPQKRTVPQTASVGRV